MQSKRQKTVQNLTLIALFAAIIAVCSWITVPVGTIPITLQTFAVCVAAGMLGWRRGCAAIAVWLGLGAVGLPVFSGFQGGIGRIVGPTGGYMVGFFATALIVGAAVSLFRGRPAALTLSMILGIAACYAFGTVWFLILMGGKSTLGGALAACVLPFILPDLVKIALATLICARMRRFLPA